MHTMQNYTVYYTTIMCTTLTTGKLQVNCESYYINHNCIALHYVIATAIVSW